MPVSDAAVEAIGGAVGSVLAVAITYPLTTVSTWQALDHKDEDKQEQMQQQQQQGQTGKLQLPSPLRELVLYSQSRGWAALFAGLKPCLAATAVSQGLYFYFYSRLRQAVVGHLAKHRGLGSAAGDGRSADIGILGSTLVASLAGAGNVVVTNPVWVVAMQMQASQRHVVRGQPSRTRTAAEVASQLYRESGIGGFWRGLAPALVMVLNPTLQYILYEWLTARLRELRRTAAAAAASGGLRPGGAAAAAARLSAGDVFVLTAVAKLGATLVTYPLLLVKSRLQAMNKATAQDAQYRGVRDAVIRILRAEGFSGFFKGIKIKMIQTVLSAALLMSIKEQLYLATRAMLKA